MDQTPNIHSDNMVQQTKDSGSESDSEIWSFDRTINEVFRLFPEELCPKPIEEKYSYKAFIRNRAFDGESCFSINDAPTQSKLVENTTKFIQSRIDSETLTKDWLCPQHLVLSLAPTKYIKASTSISPRKPPSTRT